tara:strand:- start:58 stop:180 length:123 start_codon:yes stop_codon:yes gene_type:complete
MAISRRDTDIGVIGEEAVDTERKKRRDLSRGSAEFGRVPG